MTASFLKMGYLLIYIAETNIVSAFAFAKEAILTFKELE